MFTTRFKLTRVPPSGGHTLGRFRAAMNRVRPKLGRRRPNFGPFREVVCRCRPKLSQSWPSSDGHRQTAAEIWLALARVWPSVRPRQIFGRELGPKSGRVRRTFGRAGRNSVEVGPLMWPIPGRSQPMSAATLPQADVGQTQPNMVEIRPTPVQHNPASVDLGHIRANCGQSSPSLAQTRKKKSADNCSSLANSGPVSTRCRSNLARIRPRLGARSTGAAAMLAKSGLHPETSHKPRSRTITCTTRFRVRRRLVERGASGR